MFKKNRIDELKKCYQLLSLYPKSLDVIARAFQP